MLTLQDSVKINVPPEQVFQWFDQFAENYTSWHPDHIKAEWLKGNGFQEGSVLYTEEMLDGNLEKLTFKTTRIVPNELIEFTLAFPESIICPGGSFSVKPDNGCSVFTAALTFRFGRLLSFLMRKRVSALKRHMKEEGENLKRILEHP